MSKAKASSLTLVAGEAPAVNANPVPTLASLTTYIMLQKIICEL
ncbi:hypothetical protein HanXRQr2_Chr11g0511511 [Helianthus annuus]|uniref:Uncharacterized protein n=1 Tax=Helianthus annuus TaxID=4232 RepID=A0A9K3HSK6_HELAN|nr:hypothetical protein HanXRQr2_Chr11g0511511 [Helianthus annuus]